MKEETTHNSSRNTRKSVQTTFPELPSIFTAAQLPFGGLPATMSVTRVVLALLVLVALHSQTSEGNLGNSGNNGQGNSGNVGGGGDGESSQETSGESEIDNGNQGTPTLPRRQQTVYETLFDGEPKTFEGDFVDTTALTSTGCAIVCHKKERCFGYSFDSPSKSCRTFATITSPSPVEAALGATRTFGGSLRGRGPARDLILQLLGPGSVADQEAMCLGTVFTPYDGSDANYLFIRYGQVRVGLQRVNGTWEEPGGTSPTETVLWADSYPQDDQGDCAFLDNGKIINGNCENASVGAFCLYS
ncbi:uncharacterized protein LOC143021523 [Oratosquilla oratoria]|uniref:uncharacterized protein LOC143021523 n=1 Tax=Oratosquilla oratoria TaxID=337810 RepID=UPI003F763398